MSILTKPQPGSSQEKRLNLASHAIALLATVIILVTGIPKIHDAYTHLTPFDDFRYLYNAGRLATGPDRSLLYGPRPPEDSWNAVHEYNYPPWYPYAPTAAVMTGVFTLFKINTALNAWLTLVAITTGVLAVFVASAFKSWSWRLAICAAIACWQPILLNARLGQTGVFVALTTAIAMALFIRNRNHGAWLFGAMAIKPTAIISALLLIFPEKLSVWARFVAAGALAILPVFLFWIGPGAIFRWLDILSQRGATDINKEAVTGGNHFFNEGLSSAFSLPSVGGLILAIVLLVIAAVLVQAAQPGLGIHATAGLAICIGNVVNPHSLMYEWGTAFVVIMLLRQSHWLPDHLKDLAYGLLALSLFAAGQMAWEARLHDYPIRPLTIWALVMSAGLFVTGLRPLLNKNGSDRNDAELVLAPATAQPAPATRSRPQATQEVTPSTNRNRRKREERQRRNR